MSLYSKDGKSVHKIDVPVWNETVANLTLMALGSSAPEILLSVIQTIQTIDRLPPVMGPSTIVGSAAFNLLVISGVSILAVEEPKKINDLGVFAVTSVFSLWAYIWMLVVLTATSPEYVTLVEAIITLVFFVLLIVIAFAADKINAYIEDTKKTKEEQDADTKKDEIKIKKNELRRIAGEYGENTVIEVAQGMNSVNAAEMPRHDYHKIISLY